MRVLIVTSEWPEFKNDITGIHVINQVKRLKEAGVSVSVFSFHGRKNPINYIKSALRFKSLDLTKYDLIHAHHGQSGIIALCQNKLPVVVTFHGSDLQGIFNQYGNLTLQGRILKFTSHLVAKFADEIIIVSEHLKSFLPPRSYHVIPIGIDMDMFSPLQISKARQILGLPYDKRLILFVGNPARTEKRFWLARKSVDAIKIQPNVELIICHGVAQKEMPLYMNACDVLLLTSSSEGSPTVIKEALACNLPIVSLNVGDVSLRIANVKGCLICGDSQPDTVSRALISVLEKPYRINGRESIAELDERILVKKVIDVYKSIK